MNETHSDEFDETYQSEHADPLDTRSQDFDWNTLYENLGEELDAIELSEFDAAKVAEAFRAVLQFMVDCRLDGASALKQNRTPRTRRRMGD
jgi:hypothetical protein